MAGKENEKKKNESSSGLLGWFRKAPTYDRRQIMENAAAAQGKGKSKKALAEYLKVLAMEPDNPTLLTKVAVLYAETKQPDESWKAFVKAAEIFKKDGMVDKWSSVWTQAVIYFPKSPDAWLAVAEAKAQKGVPADAASALLGGSRNFRGRKEKATRVRLLHAAFDYSPWGFDVTMEYANALVSGGLKPDAIELLTDLADRVAGKKLRKVRGKLFRLSPTPAAGWRWLKAALKRNKVTPVKSGR